MIHQPVMQDGVGSGACTKGSGSPTLNTSSDYKRKQSGMYYDLGAIFAFK